MKDPLAPLREEQDKIDREIVAAIAKRYAVRQKISAFRIENGLTTIDPARMQYVLAQAKGYAKEYGLPEEMAEEIFHVLIDWSHKLDRQWRNKDKA